MNLLPAYVCRLPCGCSSQLHPPPHPREGLVLTEPWVKLPMLFSIFPLAICFTRVLCLLSHCHVRCSVTPWTVAHQAPLSMGVSRQESWSGLPCPPPRDLPDLGIKPRSPTLQADSLQSEPPGKPKNTGMGSLTLLYGIFPTQNRTKYFRGILTSWTTHGSVCVWVPISQPFPPSPLPPVHVHTSVSKGNSPSWNFYFPGEGSQYMHIYASKYRSK